MAMFDRFKKQGSRTVSKGTEASAPAKAPAKAAPAKSTDAKPAKEEKKDAPVVQSDPRAARFASVLVKPHVSEKASVLADRGIYVFDVPVSANKIEIRKAVEAMYKVSVTDVRTARGIGKAVSRGRLKGRRNAWKKAMVQLKKGQTISIVEGV